jgi:catechol 2,3-dioxygenase-like lactoylglutathione lyase family enzyme
MIKDVLMYWSSQIVITAFNRYLKRRFAAILVFVCTLTLLWSVELSQPHRLNAQVSSSDTSSLQLHHVTLSANNVELVSQWYADYLSFTITDRFTLTRPDGRQIDVARIEIPGLRMNISKFPGSVSSDQSTENQGWRHIAFEVDDLDRTYQQLQSRGVQFITEPYTYDPPGYRVVFFRDVEGNILELYQE